MELSQYNDELCNNQLKILYLISGDIGISNIHEIMDLTEKEVEKLTNDLMKKWNVKGHPRLVIEGLIRGYTDIGYTMEHAQWTYWMQRVKLTKRLEKILLDYYDMYKTINNKILIKNINQESFLAVKGSSIQLWNEFRSELKSKSKEIKGETQALGVVLTS